MPLSRNNELDGKMTDKELFELPSFRYMGSDKDEQDKETAGTGVIGKKCSICTYEFEEGTKLRTLKCFHANQTSHDKLYREAVGVDDKGASTSDSKDVSTFAHMFGCWETLNIV